VAAGAASALNPFFLLGVQLGTKIGGNYDFSDDLIASGRVQFQPWEKAWAEIHPNLGVAFVGNFSKFDKSDLTKPEDIKKKAGELLNSSEGINASAHLFRRSTTNEKRKEARDHSLTIGWIETGLKVNGQTDSITKESKQSYQWRSGIGGELQYFMKHDDILPITISVEAVYSACVSGRYSESVCRKVYTDSAASRGALEVTLVVPPESIPIISSLPIVSKLTPVLFQVLTAKGMSPLWRINLLLMKS
jgi:hypothetical protein